MSLNDQINTQYNKRLSKAHLYQSSHYTNAVQVELKAVTKEFNKLTSERRKSIKRAEKDNVIVTFNWRAPGRARWPSALPRAGRPATDRR
jgi:hypothetical protein